MPGCFVERKAHYPEAGSEPVVQSAAMKQYSDFYLHKLKASYSPFSTFKTKKAFFLNL
jgi:hypothetical protein